MNAVVKNEGQIVTAEQAAAICSAIKSGLYPFGSDLIDVTDQNEPDIPCYESDSTFSTPFEGF